MSSVHPKEKPRSVGFFLGNHKEVHPSTVDYQSDTVNSTMFSFVPWNTRDSSGITVDQNPPNDCISYDSPESVSYTHLTLPTILLV